MKFRPKTADVDAIQWTGTNIQEVSEFVAGCKLEPRDTVATEYGSIILGQERDGRSVNFNMCMDPPIVSVSTGPASADGIEWTHTEVGGYIVRQGNECYAWDQVPFERSFEAIH